MTPSQKTLNRRDFLSKTLAGAGAATVLSAVPRPAAGRPEAAPSPALGGSAKEKPLLTRTLGKTGIVLPIVNMGVMNADNPDLVRRAYEVGMRHFDTAAGYWRGKNEEMVGKVLAELGARSKAVIATKVNIPPPQRAGLSAPALKETFLKVFDGSLRRLQTDYVDIIYVHDVSEVDDVKRPGLLEALATLKDRKKARFVGFSCHRNMAACLDEAVSLGAYDVLLVAYNYAMQDDDRLKRSLDAAAAKGIGLVAMKTQCMQSW
ncbi:MAG TPA: aldo/keto reductase, partial [Acidobacteriota bacterium]|nr:aldo/keto reductase [Acidobacteriota bacterium]